MDEMKLTLEEAIELANLTKSNIEYSTAQGNKEMLRVFINTMKAVAEVIELRQTNNHPTPLVPVPEYFEPDADNPGWMLGCNGVSVQGGRWTTSENYKVLMAQYESLHPTRNPMHP